MYIYIHIYICTRVNGCLCEEITVKGSRGHDYMISLRITTKAIIIISLSLSRSQRSRSASFFCWISLSGCLSFTITLFLHLISRRNMLPKENLNRARRRVVLSIFPPATNESCHIRE